MAEVINPTSNYQRGLGGWSAPSKVDLTADSCGSERPWASRRAPNYLDDFVFCSIPRSPLPPKHPRLKQVNLTVLLMVFPA